MFLFVRYITLFYLIETQNKLPNRVREVEIERQTDRQTDREKNKMKVIFLCVFVLRNYMPAIVMIHKDKRKEKEILSEIALYDYCGNV